MNVKSLSAQFALIVGILISVVSMAQPTNHRTPTNESVCNGLIGQAPGLYGLCVAFCEAQDCTATYNSTTGEMVYDAKCKPSSSKLLENFNNVAGEGGPTMPCVNGLRENSADETVEGIQCPCWTEAELDYIADGQSIFCKSPSLYGYDGTNYNQIDFASASFTASGSAATCFYNENSPPTTRYQEITDEQFNACQISVYNECLSRGMQ